MISGLNVVDAGRLAGCDAQAVTHSAKDGKPALERGGSGLVADARKSPAELCRAADTYGVILCASAAWAAALGP